MNELEEYFNFEYLDKLATKERIYFSPSIGWDKISSKKVYEKRIEILNDIIKKIKEKKYKFVPYKVNLLIKNEESNPRKTCIPAVKDRIVISVIKNYLYDKFGDETFNVPANQIVEEVKDIFTEGKYIFYKKFDLSAFFDNINHDILIEKISEKVINKDILDLIIKIIKNPQKIDETDEKKENLLGVPQGISIATILANIYLHEFDANMKKKNNIKYYRYIDDIIIFAAKMENIESISKEIEYSLKRRSLLIINEKKTEKGNILEGLEYLGYKFNGEIVSVRKSSILKFERNLENIFKNFYSIKEKDETQIKKFIWLLNVKITGIMVDGKKYGWLFYFSCINDKTLLKRMDILVRKFIKRFKIEKYIDLENIKKFTKTYYDIKYKIGDSKYLLNLNLVTEEDKKTFLKEICLIDNAEKLTREELEYQYRYNLYRTLKSLEKDIDNVSG